MANTMAVAQGHDSGRIKRTSRLGSKAAEAHANTWHTFGRVYTEADGTVTVTIRRGERSVSVTVNPEDEPLRIVRAFASVGVLDVRERSATTDSRHGPCVPVDVTDRVVAFGEF